MTETTQVETSQVAVRVIATELTAQGRTVDCRIVPYGQRAKANDGLGGFPNGVMYEEEVIYGAFDHQLNAANRVHMNYEHQPGIAGIVGHGIALRSEIDGLYGSFKLHDTPAGNTALELVKDGALGGISFESKFAKSVRSAAGVIQRVKCNLVNVALCREPAYENAVVLGLRTEIEDFTIDQDLLLPDFDLDLAKRVEALGKDVPEGLKAHPALADTSTDESVDTSEAAPAESEDNTDKEE